MAVMPLVASLPVQASASIDVVIAGGSAVTAVAGAVASCVLDASSLVPTFRATIPITGLPAGSVLQKGNSIAPLPDDAGPATYTLQVERWQGCDSAVILAGLLGLLIVLA